MGIVKFENFLSEDLYEECSNFSNNILSKDENLFYTNKSWAYNIVRDSFPVLIHELNKNKSEANKLLFFKIENEVRNKVDFYDKDQHFITIMFYYWTRFSYIPWHNDGPYPGAITVYLNREWNTNNGGYFLYEENDEIKAIIPKRNLAVLQRDGVRHCTTPVNYDGNLRQTLQIFIVGKTNEEIT